MGNWLFLSVAALYILVSATLFLFGVNFIYLSWIALRRGHERSMTRALIRFPVVTVQLPIFNELYVAERLIRSVAAFDYPREKLQIQVLDDSTDETGIVVSRLVANLQSKGIDVEHLTRVHRSGFKAGALQAGMATAKGEFIAIFDADFVPSPDFLEKALPDLLSDSRCAFVQTRWGHLNRNDSWLTFLQSLAIDAHFMVEQFARSRLSLWFNFNGTAGIWRRQTLEDVGGWRADTLTEDLDISYRAYLAGWHGRYLRHVMTPAELPVSFTAFRRQQHRWARGSLECAVKLLSQVWRAPISRWRKLQATLHLAGYSVHMLLFLLLLLYPLVATYASYHPGFSQLFGLGYLFALTSLAPTIFFAVGQQQADRSWWRTLPQILLVSVIGSGMMLNTMRAFLGILSRRRAIFERTAKFGTANDQSTWTQRRYQIPFDAIALVELPLGLFGLASAWWAIAMGSFGIAFYAALFGAGLLMAAIVTILQSSAIFFSRESRRDHIIAEQRMLRPQHVEDSL